MKWFNHYKYKHIYVEEISDIQDVDFISLGAESEF